jgi:hypothetical protein
LRTYRTFDLKIDFIVGTDSGIGFHNHSNRQLDIAAEVMIACCHSRQQHPLVRIDTQINMAADLERAPAQIPQQRLLFGGERTPARGLEMRSESHRRALPTAFAERLQHSQMLGKEGLGRIQRSGRAVAFPTCLAALLALFLDDLRWPDAATLDLLDDVPKRCRRAVAIVGSFFFSARRGLG